MNRKRHHYQDESARRPPAIPTGKPWSPSRSGENVMRREHKEEYGYAFFILRSR